MKKKKEKSRKEWGETQIEHRVAPKSEIRETKRQGKKKGTGDEELGQERGGTDWDSGTQEDKAFGPLEVLAYSPS